MSRVPKVIADGGVLRSVWAARSAGSQRLIGAVTAAGLCWLSFPPVGWWWLAPFGLAAAFATLWGARRGWMWASLFGTLFLTAHCVWLLIVGGVPALVGMLALQVPFFAVFGSLAAVLTRQTWPIAIKCVGLAVLWVALESARSRLPFGGFSWGRMAFSQSEGLIGNWAPVVGAAGVGALVALLASALTVLLAQRAWRLALAVMAAVLIGGGAVGLMPPKPTHGVLTTTLVQGTTPQWGPYYNVPRGEVFRRHLEQTDLSLRTAGAARPDVIIWPEVSVDRAPQGRPEVMEPLVAQADAANRPMLVGAVERGSDGAVYNASMVVQPGRGLTQIYRKRHIVPFGEYVPMRPIFGKLPGVRGILLDDFGAGEQPARMHLGGQWLGPLICYEVADDDDTHATVAMGINVLVVQTNNAVFGRLGQAEQHLAMSKFRAKQYALPVAHVSTVGVTGAFNAEGTQLTSIALGKAGWATVQLPVRSDVASAPWVFRAVEGLLLIMAAILSIALLATSRGRWRKAHVTPTDAQHHPQEEQ